MHNLNLGGRANRRSRFVSRVFSEKKTKVQENGGEEQELNFTTPNHFVL
jgi:hypothetical protein